jgi:hypothetical protein
MTTFEQYLEFTEISEQFKSADDAYEYAKKKSDSGHDIEVYHHNGEYHVNHEMNSQGRNHLIKSGAKKIAVACDGKIKNL